MQRIHSIDLLKIVIAVGVVWGHALLMTQDGGVIAYLLGHGLARTVVPIFAVVSGFLFFFTERGGKAKPWLIRLFVFYLFWCVVYLPIWWPNPATIPAVAENLFFGPIHLWYLAALLPALTILRMVVAHSGSEEGVRRRLFWIALLCLSCGTLTQSTDYFTAIDLPLNAYRNALFMEFPFVSFGYLIAAKVKRDGIDGLPPVLLLCGLLAVLVVLRLAEAWVSMRTFGLSIVAPPEFPFLLAAFAVVIVMLTLRLKVPQMPVNFGYLSMMIYFLHMGFLVIGLHFGVQDAEVLTVIGLVASVLSALALQAVLPLLPRSVPKLRAFAGFAGLQRAEQEERRP